MNAQWEAVPAIGLSIMDISSDFKDIEHCDATLKALSECNFDLYHL
jgi:hypothetical protein